ncbi:hypothetical protein EYF80_037930 [Liparis tanakae]|uniref:Uncharacterized protein n=1 Tax=Liparis tanakae TaxID=230148 RepID=A0A4Z2GGH1_9TELE|nr:hypothetical protein EYF80_037930 [Liparis tanakae]
MRQTVSYPNVPVGIQSNRRVTRGAAASPSRPPYLDVSALPLLILPAARRTETLLSCSQSADKTLVTDRAPLSVTAALLGINPHNGLAGPAECLKRKKKGPKDLITSKPEKRRIDDKNAAIKSGKSN